MKSSSQPATEQSQCLLCGFVVALRSDTIAHFVSSSRPSYIINCSWHLVSASVTPALQALIWKDDGRLWSEATRLHVNPDWRFLHAATSLRAIAMHGHWREPRTNERGFSAHPNEHRKHDRSWLAYLRIRHHSLQHRGASSVWNLQRRGASR